MFINYSMSITKLETNKKTMKQLITCSNRLYNFDHTSYVIFNSLFIYTLKAV